MFFVNVPFGVATFLIIMATLPKAPPRSGRPSIDYAGAVLLALGLTPLLLSLVWGGSEYSWTSPTILTLVAVGIVGLGMFLFIEPRVKEPILPLDLFKNRIFTVSAMVTFLSAMCMFGVLLFIPLYAQVVVGFSATNSGLILTPMMVGVVGASAVVGNIVTRTGRYRAVGVIGMLIATLGAFLFSRVSVDTTALELVVDMLVIGIGLGATMPIFAVVVQNAFDNSKLGVVTASTQLFRSVGSTVAAALFGGLLNARIADGLASLANDPFLQQLRTLIPGAASGTLNANAIQGILGTRGQAALEAAIARLPPDVQAQVIPQMEHFVAAVKVVISDAVGFVFLGATLAMALGVVAAAFIPQVELHRPKRPAMEEAGAELEAELGQLDAANEPDLTEGRALAQSARQR